jgi:cysteinyl-tRNA synthetase
MANYWMHNGFLQVEGEKMAKSAGNFVTIRELLQDWQGNRWPPDAVRFAMLRTHYRQPIDWTLHALEQASGTLVRWYEAIGREEAADSPPANVVDALSDDLNTPQTISELHGLHNDGRKPELKAALRFLGFSCDRQSLVRTASVSGSLATRVEMLVEARTAARKAKNFAESDRIREELAAMGVVLKDSKDGTTWEIAR